MQADGSSPRMWGTPLRGTLAFGTDRFIPTHVGNTNLMLMKTGDHTVHPHACGEHFLCSFSVNVFCSVHPHACGEHLGRFSSESDYSGSSPRMWGTLNKYGIIPGQFRFIPTHVGNTLQKTKLATLIAVHPHACGEHI